MAFQEAVGYAVGAAVSALIIGVLITSAGNYIELVETTEDWNNAINDGASSSYDVVNDTAVLETSSATIQTNAVNISDAENVTFEATSVEGNLTVTLYDGSDTSLYSASLQGEETTSYDVADSVDEYYVEFTNDQTADSVIDSYSTKEPSDRLATFLQIMALAVIGAAAFLIFETL